MHHPATALVPDASALGLRPVTVLTQSGAVRAHVGRGDGDVATLLLHGAAGSWTTWTPLLAQACRAGTPLSDVIAVDLPGWGDSGAPAPSIEALSRSVAEVAAALGYRRWRVVGHSLGGSVALDIAARHPLETVAVGTVSPSGAGVRDAARRPLRGGLRLPGFAGMLLAMRLLRALGPAARPLLRGLRTAGALRVLARPLFSAPRLVDRSVTDALADEIRPVAFVAAVEATRDYDLDRWRSIRCPVRSVRGARDVFSRSDDAAQFAVRIPDFAETALPGAGHFAAVEQPAAVLRALAEVLHPAAPSRPRALDERTSPRAR